MEFSRQECWSGLPFPPPGDLPDPRIEPTSPALASGFFTTEPRRKPTSNVALSFSGLVLQKESWVSQGMLLIVYVVEGVCSHDEQSSDLAILPPDSGLEVLAVQRVSKTQAWQRTGRAGREDSGICYRLYTEDEFEKFEKMTVPEIQR